MRKIGYGISLFLLSIAAFLYPFLTHGIQRAGVVTLSLLPSALFYWLWPLLFGGLLAAAFLLREGSVGSVVLTGVFALVNLSASLTLVYGCRVFYPVYSPLLAGVFAVSALVSGLSLRRKTRQREK